MLIKFMNQENSWVYKNEAVVALVGKNSTKQFYKTSLSIEELRTAFPFVCFDTSSQDNYNLAIFEQEIERKLKAGINERLNLCQTDMLFILSELESTEDIDTCVKYAEQLESDGRSFFVTHSKNIYRDDLMRLSTKFSYIIYVEDAETNLFYPVKQLLIDYYRRSLVGIDMTDIRSVFPSNQKMESYFVRYTFHNIRSMNAFIPELLRWIKLREKATASYPNFLLFMEVSQTAQMDEIDEVVCSIIDNYKDSELIWSFVFNSEPDNDNCTLSLQTVFRCANLQD